MATEKKTAAEEKKVYEEKKSYKEKIKELKKKYKLLGKLEEQAVADDQKIQKNVINNLRYIQRAYEIESQNDLADILDISPPQLSRILKGEQMPSLSPCLINIYRQFGFTIHDFIFNDVELIDWRRRVIKENLPVVNDMKYSGIYQFYYFDTSENRGREKYTHGDALMSGIMFIDEKKPEADKQDVMAVFNMSKERADSFYENTLKAGKVTATTCKDIFKNLSGAYYGELEFSVKHFFISLNFGGLKDRVQMIFHFCPDSNEREYIGGLGTMLSPSKSRISKPCFQYVALVKASMDVSEEEIAAHLLLRYPQFEVCNTAMDDLVNFTADLYRTDVEANDRLSKLPDVQKKTLVKNYVDKIVNETVENNMLRTVAVSGEDDEAFCRYIKRVNVNMHAEVK